MKHLLAIALTAAFTCSSLVAAEIQPDQIQPGSDIRLAMPELGKSWRSKGADPVEMRVILPKTLDKKQSYPLLLFLDGGFGSPDKAKWWADMMSGEQFIFLGVDYSSDKGYGSGFDNAQAALELVEKHVKVDRKKMAVGGFSSGAYAITDGCIHPFGKQFLCYMPFGGGMPISPATVKNKHFLWLCGDKDTSPASAGQSRFEAAKKAHEALVAGKVDSKFIAMQDIGHSWPRGQDTAIREWILENLVFPELAQAYLRAVAAEKRGDLGSAYSEYSRCAVGKYKDAPAKTESLKKGYDDPFRQAMEAIQKEKDYHNAMVTFNKLLKTYGKPMAADCEAEIQKLRNNPEAVLDSQARGFFLQNEQAFAAGRLDKAGFITTLKKVLEIAPGTRSSIIAQERLTALQQ